jgi:LDH2 family malate/lactate/ureidoglycolate dehydrogenase
MNRPPEEFILVREERLLAFASACFGKAGLEEEQAALIARFLVNCDLRGVRSHGTATLDGYCRGFEQGSYNARPEIRVVRETSTAVVVDGDGGLGYLPMVRATEAAIDRAKELGLGMGLARHIGHYGAAGHYTRMCTEAGCIGFSVQAYRDQGNARGGEKKPQIGYFGNPPICFAIPGGEEPDVVLDGGTRVLPDDKIGPEYDDLLTRIPSAFYKSIGFTTVASLLGGGLTGFTLPEADAIRERWPGAGLGGMVLAIDIDSVVPEQVFREETDRMARDVRETYEPMPGTDRVVLPGAIEEEWMALHRSEGIRYGEREQGAARSASERLGVALPWD